MAHRKIIFTNARDEKDRKDPKDSKDIRDPKDSVISHVLYVFWVLWVFSVPVSSRVPRPRVPGPTHRQFFP